ncbi:hypothetical protein BKA70DRAFT_1438684 [Coprinopsis sp. MPI-PUGE-AT-0042]|nr:hypothetical protein BKA70DRAFT_1438684 [Coprinopsis sp. MPI-PUGE-AT-0042]
MPGSKEAIWPPKIEAALLEGLMQLASRPPAAGGRAKTHRELSDFIATRTNQVRTPKQVASRLQNMQRSCKDPQLSKFLSNWHPRWGTGGSSQPIISRSATKLPLCLSEEHGVSCAFVKLNLPGPWTHSLLNRMPNVVVVPNTLHKPQDLILLPSTYDALTPGYSSASSPNSFHSVVVPGWNIELKTQWEVYVGEVLVHRETGHLVQIPSAFSESAEYGTAFPDGVWARATQHTDLQSITIIQFLRRHQPVNWGSLSNALSERPWPQKWEFALVYRFDYAHLA